MGKKIGVVTLVILVFAFSLVSFKLTGSTSEIGHVSKYLLSNTIKVTGAINAVTAIVFGFRGYDTLGESIVLFTAICGVSAVLRPQKKAKEDR